MNERELEITIRALEWAIIEPVCTDVECRCGFTNLDRAVAYNARDALAAELRSMRHERARNEGTL